MKNPIKTIFDAIKKRQLRTVPNCSNCSLRAGLLVILNSFQNLGLVPRLFRVLFRGGFAVFLITSVPIISIILILSTPVVLNATEGAMVYFSSSTSAGPFPPAYSTSTASGFAGTETKLSMATPQAPQDQTGHWLIKVNPNTTEAILLTLDVNARINAQYWNGTSWQVTGGTATWITGGNVAVKHYDFAYFANDSTYKRGIVVYSRSAAPRLAYKIWYSTAGMFDIADRQADGTTRTYRWVRTEPIPGTNKVVCVAQASTAGQRFSYAIYDLDTGNWTTGILGDASGVDSTTVERYFDLAVENSGEAMAVWVDTNNATSLSYSTWTVAGGWAASPLSVGYGVTHSTRTTFVRLSNKPNSDEITLAFTYRTGTGTTRQLAAVIWDGSAWGNGAFISANTTNSSQSFDVNYERSSGNCLIAFSSSTLTPVYYTTRLSGQTVWSATTLGTDWLSQGQWLRLVREISAASDDIYLMANCADNSVKWQKWNGGVWGAVTAVETNSLSTRQSFDMAIGVLTTPDTTLPAAISDLTGLTGINDGDVILSWTSPGDDGMTNNITGGQYDLRYSTNSIGNETDFSNILASYRIVKPTDTVPSQLYSLTVTGLNPGTSFYFALKYKDESDNWSTWSTGTYTNTASTAAAQDLFPNAVVTSTAVGGNTQITLTWTYPSVPAGVNDYDKFWVYRSTASFTEPERNDSQYVFVVTTAAYLLGNQTTFFVDTGLTNLTTYYYHISLFDKDDQGQGLYSVPKESFSVVEVSTIPWEAPPAAPSGFTGIAQSTYSIQWSWTDVAGESGYRVRYTTSSAPTDEPASPSLNADVVNWTESNLLANTSYYRVVVATNSAGESSLSDPATTYTLAAPPLPAVSTFTLVGYSSVTINWVHNPDNPSWTRYGVITSTSPEFVGTGINVSTAVTFAQNLTANTTTVFGLTADTSYWFRIIAINEDQIQTAFIQSSTMTKVGPPTAPSGLTPLAVYTSSIQWQFTDNATNETGLYISSGNYTRLSENLGPLTGTGTTSWWEIDLGTNTPCTRYAEATNANGSVWSASITSYTAAAVPTSPVATTNNTTSINLTWNANNNPSPATKYGVKYATATDFYVSTTAYNFASGLTATTTIVYNLSAGTTYWFRVCAYNGDTIETAFTASVSTRTNNLPVVTLINENFDGGKFPPTDWAVNDITLSTSITRYVSSPYSVSYSAAGKYLFTPLLDDPTEITFQLYVTGSPSTFTVERGTSQVTSGTWVTVFSTGGIASSWQTQTIDLSGLQNIYLRMSRTGGSNTFNLDDVVIKGYPEIKSPAGISNLTALPGSAEGTIVLNWTSPGDDGTVGNLTGQFEIKYTSVAIITSANYGSPPSPNYSFTISTTSLTPLTACTTTMFGLTPGTSYWFAIKTADEVSNWSVWNSSANVLTINTSAYASAQDFTPVAPANFTSLTGDTQILLSWTANAESDLSYYKIYRDTTDPYDFTDGMTPGTTPYNFTTFTDTGLQNGTSHVYRLTAVDRTGHESAYSDIISTIPASGPPFAPTNLTAVLLGPTSVQWRFTDNANNEDGLFIATGTWPSNYWESLGTLTGTGLTTSWWQLNLSTNTQYTVSAGATNAYGASWTAAVSTYTLAVTPSNLVATTNNSTSINLSWSAGQNPGTTRYGLSRATNSTFTTGVNTFVNYASALTANTTVAYNLSSGTTYWFRVWAYNGAAVPTSYYGDGDPLSSSATTPSPSGASGLLINEVSCASTPDWVEIYVQTGGNYSNYRFYEGGTLRKTFPATFNPSSGQYIVINFNSVTADEDDGTGDTNANGYWDFYTTDTGLVSTDEVLGIRMPSTDTWIDGVCYSNRDGGTTTTFEGNYNTAIASNAWVGVVADTTTAADDAAVQAACASVSSITATTTIGRNFFFADSNSQSDWGITMAASPGAQNNVPDLTPPNAIPDLVAVPGGIAGGVDLSWTAPGDDGETGNNGAGSYYQLKYATYSASVAGSTVTWWNNAVTYFQAWTVGAQGSGESQTLNLTPDITYWFAIRTVDSTGNVSTLDTGTTVQITAPGSQATATAPTGNVGSSIRINEIAPDQTSGQGYDYIEFYNPGPATPNIQNWSFYDCNTSSSVYIDYFEGSWVFPANSYLVLRLNQTTRQMTNVANPSANYYEIYTDQSSGIAQTDNIIIVASSRAVNNNSILDAVCYGDQSGTITNSTRLREAYNFVVSTGQWFGPIADGSNDAAVENSWASTLYAEPPSSGWSIARGSTSADGTNPSNKEWALTPSTSRGGVNPAFDITAPAAVNNLSVVSGDNRGTVRLAWTAPGDDGNTGTASGYIIKYRTDIITPDNFDSSSDVINIAKDSQTDSTYLVPKVAGQAESRLLFGGSPGSIDYFALKTDDERPNRSAISNVVSTAAANVIGSNVRLNEISPMGAVSGDDWIEFYCARGTATTDTVNINGWKILNTQGTIKTLPDITLTRGDYLVWNCAAGTDETNATGKGANGYWDVYGLYDLPGSEGVFVLEDSVGNIVDFVAYSKGSIPTPTWNTIWANAAAYLQWSPASPGVASAADWATGFSTTSLGRDSFSTDTDDTSSAKNDWMVFTVPTKGKQNDNVPPAGISNLTALAGSDGVYLLWTSPGDDGTVGNLTGTFRVNRSSVGIVTAANFTNTTSSFATVVDISTSSLVPLTMCNQFITGFTLSDNNKPFWFAMKTVDDNNNWSVWNSSADVLTVNTSAYAVIQIFPPNQISDLSALTGTNDGNVILNWTAPGDDGTVGNISSGGYWVKYSTNPLGNETAFNNATTFTVKSTDTVTQQSYSTTVTGLNPGTSYYFALKYRDEVTDNWASWSTGTVNTLSYAAAQDLPPAAPSGIIRTAANARVTLSWNAGSEYDLAQYNIYRASWNAGAYTLIASTPAGYTGFVDTGLRNNNTYYYRLSAVDRGDSGNGLYSVALESSLSAAVSTAPFIMPPVLVSAEYSGSNIDIVWTHSPDFSASNFSSYRIYYSTLSGGPYTLAGSTPSGTSFADAIVSPRVQTIYYYVLTTRDADGEESIYSNEKMANPDTVPPTVTHTLVTEINVLGGYAIFVATITDLDNTGARGTVVSAKLYYQLTGGSWLTVSTSSVVGDLYTFKIGPIDATFLVDFKYYIEAKDVASNDGYIVIAGDTKTATTAPTVDVKTQTAVTTLTSGGGTVSVSDGDQTDGETSVTIPSGAMATNIPIQILQKGYSGDPAPPPVAFKNEDTPTIAANSTGPVVCFDFTPDNTQFKKPVVLTIRYLDQDNDGEIDDRPGILETALRIYYWDNWEWRYIGGTVDTAKNTVSGYVDHFTLFALFPKGAIPVKPTAKEKFITPVEPDGKNDRIQFECDSAIRKIEIYDVTGRKIRTIDNGSDNWDGKDEDGNVLESGVYIYKVEAVSGQKRTGAVVLAK